MKIKKNICVYGLGFVGFPLLLLFAKSNQNTIGVDINKSTINKFKKGIIPFYERNLQNFFTKICSTKNI